MKPPLKQRIIKRICKVFGHKEYTHFYAGEKHYYCKRCGSYIGVSLTWQEKIILDQIGKETEEE